MGHYFWQCVKVNIVIAAVAPRQVLPYPAIVGRNGSCLHVQWDVQVMDPQEKGKEQQNPEPCSEEAEDKPHESMAINSTDNSYRCKSSDESDNRAGDTNNQVLEKNAFTDKTSSLLLNLDLLTKTQVLAVQTRAQKKRQEQQLEADATATAASGVVIHSLDKASLVDGSNGGSPVDQDSGPTRDARLSEADGSGEESEAGDEEGRKLSVVITDPFTRQQSINQQKAATSLKPLFEAATLGDPECFVRDDIQ